MDLFAEIENKKKEKKEKKEKGKEVQRQKSKATLNHQFHEHSRKYQ